PLLRLPPPSPLFPYTTLFRSSLSYPFLEMRGDHHSASHDDLSDGYERISRFHLSQLAYLAERLDAMPEGDGTVLDNCCLLWLSKDRKSTRLNSSHVKISYAVF